MARTLVLLTADRRHSTGGQTLDAEFGSHFGCENFVTTPMLTPAALERTYLAFNRTANHFASAGVTIGQLLILHDDRRQLGRVLSTIIISLAIVTELVGIVEYFRQHHALIDTSVYKRGTALNTIPNMVAVAGIGLLICGGLFVTIMVVA